MKRKWFQYKRKRKTFVGVSFRQCCNNTPKVGYCIFLSLVCSISRVSFSLALYFPFTGVCDILILHHGDNNNNWKSPSARTTYPNDLKFIPLDESRWLWTWMLCALSMTSVCAPFNISIFGFVRFGTLHTAVTICI